MEAVKMPRPTDAELKILRVLWDHGPCTVREVQEVLSQRKNLGYTTALKMLQIMTQKGLVLRDESRRSHVYTPAHAEADMQAFLVRDLCERAFNGSRMRMASCVVAAQDFSEEEWIELRSVSECGELCPAKA